MKPMEPALAARAVTKRFPGVVAVDGVDFDVFPREIVALLGANGAGKSTLIQVLAGVHPWGSYEGQVRLAEAEYRPRSVAEEQYWEAIQLLETSIGRVEGKMKQLGRVLLARAYSKNPNWVKQGEELLQTVIREDPQNVDAHFHLAAIYRAGNLKSRAQASLRRVLELDPGHVEARVQLQALDADNPPPPSAEPGLFKKLLRRK